MTSIATVVLMGSMVGSYGQTPSNVQSMRTAQHPDGHEIRLIQFEVAEEWSPTIDFTFRQAPPADYHVARIHIEIVFSKRPFAAPARVEVVDVLGRSYVEDDRTRDRTPFLHNRARADEINAAPLPVTLVFKYSIPIRPSTPIKTLIVDGIEFADPSVSTAPNQRLHRSPRTAAIGLRPGWSRGPGEP